MQDNRAEPDRGKDQDDNDEAVEVAFLPLDFLFPGLLLDIGLKFFNHSFTPILLGFA